MSYCGAGAGGGDGGGGPKHHLLSSALILTKCRHCPRYVTPCNSSNLHWKELLLASFYRWGSEA